jgi:phasin
MASGSKKSARAPLMAAPVAFEPNPAAEIFDPGPAPADLAAPADLDLAPEIAAFELPPVVAAPEPVEALEVAPLAVAAPIVEAVETAKIELVAAAPAKIHDIQDKTRALVEKSLAQTRAHYAKAKTAAEEATSAIEASYGAAKSGAINFQLKALEAVKSHADANFEFVKSIVAVKSLSDYVTLNTEFARKQVEALTAQSKEMGVLAQKVANDSAEPIKAHIAKTFKIAV